MQHCEAPVHVPGVISLPLLVCGLCASLSVGERGFGVITIMLKTQETSE